MKKILLVSSIGLIGLLAILTYLYFRRGGSPRDTGVVEWILHPQAHPDWVVKAGTRCSSAPLLFPTDGFIGYLWRDTFDASHLHQGIDIFGGGEPGSTAVIAAADGFLSRLPDWKSSLILRLPEDPLQPGRQIWLYYTHMAGPDGNSLIAADYPPGINEVFVKAGTQLGYQGNYSGTAGRPVGVHLHFSIVLDDGGGKFLNELKVENTLDPSPYLGLDLNIDAQTNPAQVVVCKD